MLLCLSVLYTHSSMECSKLSVFPFPRMSCNEQKNRYRNVLPSDDTRVCLQSVPGHIEGSDYINANYITVHPSCPTYIATQGPLPNTVDDFWQMTWETEIECIAMLTNPIENGRVKSEV